MQPLNEGAEAPSAVPSPGLLRSTQVGREPAATLRHLFANLRGLTRGEPIGEDPDHNAEASRLRLDRTDGHGSYELYRLDRDLFILTIDCLFDAAREEIVPGEGLLEIHLCVRGRLTLRLPETAQLVVVQGPGLLFLYQPVGADVAERLEAGVRYTGLSLYCRLSYLSDLMGRNGIRETPLLHAIARNPGGQVWHERRSLSARLHHVVADLLQSPYQRGFRLLHSEAKALELLCEVLSPGLNEPEAERSAGSTTLVRQIDTVRRILSTQYAPIPHIHELARRVGMSESKLKRVFKARFGTTVFNYGLDCRMRHALELLCANSMSICQVAESAGYQHQTSFTAAFRDHFGFLPSETRPRPGPRRSVAAALTTAAPKGIRSL
jgi:AraC-like DNA-binding protein